jgi:hypothetical protein
MVERASEEDMQRAAAALVSHALEELDRGQSPAEVERDLTRKGFSPDVASAIVQRALTMRSHHYQHDEGAHKEASAGGTDMAIGGVICLVGILITAVTYSASSGGGTYVVAWGAIIFGAIRFFKGLAA